MRQDFYVEQVTGTGSDALTAFGFMRFVAQLLPQDDDWGLEVVDEGGYYRVSLEQSLTQQMVEGAMLGHLFRGLNTAKKKVELPNAVDYVGHQERNRAYFEARQKKLDEAQLRELGLTPPHVDWPAWAVINQMSAVSLYNKLALLWDQHRVCYPELVDLVLDLYRTRPNDVGAVEAKWKKLAKQHKLPTSSKVAQLQVINPGMGKGGNNSKATGLSIGGLKGFWLPEYLKWAGLFQAALPRTVRGRKDRKTYVLRPRRLSLRTHRRVFRAFQPVFYGQTAVKMDILAMLQYCEVFLTQWQAGQPTKRQRRRGQPGDHVAALEVVSYKYMGSAHAAMNLSTLVLPMWLPEVETAKQAKLFVDMLKEHQQVVRFLEEDKGNEYELLRTYRDFLSGRDLRAFFRFTHGYGRHVMSKLAKGGYPPRRFTVPNLEILIMNHDQKLTPILQNEGFRRIAEAIRNSTVRPQYFKSTGKAGPYQIRYGLGTDLLRNASYPEKFSQALSRFVFAYNKENGQVLERFKGKPPVRRKDVRTTDLAEVIALVDEYEDSETVANLLVAFGYAREPKEG